MSDRLVFLDVGAHDGQTLTEVIKPRWGFDWIHAFEPMPDQFTNLEPFADDPRVFLHPFGLSHRTGEMPVYGDNARMEASIYPSKRDVDESVVTACRSVRATDFLNVLAPQSTVIVKLNCEGAEIPILTDLAESGAIHHVAHVLIDFDCRKVDGLDGADTECLALLADVGFDRFTTEWPAGVTHQDRIANWLEGVL